MKVLHRPIFIAIVAAIDSVFNLGKYVDKVVESEFKRNKKFGARDRSLFAEAVYDIVRNWRRFYESLGFSWSDDLVLEPKGESFPREVISNAVALWWSMKDGESMPYFQFDELPQALERWNSFENGSRVQKYSLTDWIDSSAEQQLPGRWGAILPAISRPAPLFIRIQKRVAEAEAVAQELRQEKISVQILSPTLLQAERGSPVFKTAAYKAGKFEVQDGGSQQISPFLEVQAGHRVVDACAGAGGKTLHLADLMSNKGKIIAMDIHEWKLAELSQRTRRAKVDIVETRLIDTTKVIKRLVETADRVLLDVPCSGLGVLRRNADSKWKLTSDDVLQLLEIQKNLLKDYSQMTKVGGKMVYSTCSLFPSENEKQIQFFLSQNENWALEEEKTIWPDETPFDGFYMARLLRKS